MVTLSYHKMTAEEIVRQLGHFDDDKGPYVIAVATVFFSFALTLVFLRFVTKKVKRIDHGLEDYLITVALVSTACMCLSFHDNIVIGSCYGSVCPVHSR